MCSKVFALSLIFSLLIFSTNFAGTQEVDSEQGITAKGKIGTSLIRMDLLPKKETLPPPVQRDIFSPQPATFANSTSGLAERAIPLTGVASSEGSKEKAEESISPWAGHRINLRYIGYVGSSQKTIALVILEGLALAVEEGDFLEPEVKVESITTDEIVLGGPNGEKRQFSLEGEKT